MYAVTPRLGLMSSGTASTKPICIRAIRTEFRGNMLARLDGTKFDRIARRPRSQTRKTVLMYTNQVRHVAAFLSNCRRQLYSCPVAAFATGPKPAIIFCFFLLFVVVVVALVGGGAMCLLLSE